jgi:1-acyl-sn-glycerol-3-phosphate acyltransferase
MPKLINHVQPGMAPIVPALNLSIVRLVHLALPLMMRFRFFPWLPAKIRAIEVINSKTLTQCYQQFQAGKIRLVLAFRHVEVDDPMAGLYVLSRTVPQVARSANIPLKYPLHAHFLYDRGMPIWGGSLLGWMLSRIGGVSIHRGKRPDWQALRQARDLVTNGDYPFVVAPEGATNGHSEAIGPLEPGVAQLAFWAVEDIEKAARSESVMILPIGLQYHYVDQPWDRLNELMLDLESTMGLPLQPILGTNPDSFYQRLLVISETLLIKLEKFYQQFYPGAAKDTNNSVADTDRPHSEITQRITQLLDHALGVAESYFNIPAQGTPVDRCRRLEELSWMQIYRSDLDQASALDRGLADWMAQEASLRIIHMRLAESFVAVTGHYVAEKPSFERLAEMTLLMFDAIARLRGDKLPQRPNLGWRKITMTVTEPISVSDRFAQYSTNRRSARAAIDTLTEDIRQALVACFETENK